MVFFRTDSNTIIAGGHVMRCLAISKALVNVGESVHFLVADDNSVPVLREAGVQYTVLNSCWQNLMSDAEKVKEIIRREKDPVLLIDTYSVTREYVDYLKPFAKIVYLGSKQEFLGNIDLLINYSTDIDYDFYHRNYTENTSLLLGPSYAPLREEFQKTQRIYKKSIEHILLTTGNTDKDHMVDLILKDILPLISGTQIVINVVIGRMFDNINLLRMKYCDNPNVCFHEHVVSMSALMKKCDLAISANGTTVYELSAVGVPTITFAMVQEQTKSAETLANLGVVDYCGRSYEDKEGCSERIKDRVGFYLKNNRELIVLAKKAHALVDGNGCYKIVDRILHL